MWHNRIVPPFDQGNLGSCTGNALVGCLMTTPTHVVNRMYNETTAIALYSQATHLDPNAIFSTEYPPNDVGSNSTDVCMAGLRDKYIKQFVHANDLTETLIALQLYPVMIGINWYDSFDVPNTKGDVSISPNAQVRGGHEIYLTGMNPQIKRVALWNSWGASWGQSGMFHMSFDTLDRLLNEQSDATVPMTV